MDFLSHNLGETQKIAQNLAKKYFSGGWFLLFGDLGSGKTTFAKYFAQALGVDGNVTSPTFVIMKNYIAKSGKKLVHIDAYRLNGSADAESIGIEEMRQDKNSYIMVEWPEKIADALPEESVRIYFEYVSENERKIRVED